MRILILIATALSLTSCASSLVYDPSLQMPAAQLHAGDAQVSAGAAYLLETRPDRVDRKGVIGGTLQLRGAFSERVTVGIRHWFAMTDLPDGSTSGSEETFYRGGVGGEVLINLGDLDPSPSWSLLGRVAVLYGEGSTNGVQVDGAGYAVQVLTASNIGDVRLTGALGPVFGLRDPSEADEWGAGAIANAGAAVRVTGGLDVIADLAGLVYYDARRQVTRGAIAPALSLSLSF